MKFIETPFDGLYIIEANPFIDERGEFYRYFCKEEFSQIGHQKEFLQMNHSYTKEKGTFRGLHYQIPPKGEAKFARCIQGSLLDVVVDVRKNSKTFLKSHIVELSAENGKSIYVPEGFAHGYFTLEDHSTLNYATTANYQPDYERGLNIKDPRLGIKLPNEIRVLSEKDSNCPYITNSFVGI